jgi:hypothetical protein
LATTFVANKKLTEDQRSIANHYEGQTMLPGDLTILTSAKSVGEFLSGNSIVFETLHWNSAGEAKATFATNSRRGTPLFGCQHLPSLVNEIRMHWDLA